MYNLSTGELADEEGDSLYHYCVRKQEGLVLLENLLPMGIKLSDMLQRKNRHGHTFLHIAFKEGFIQVSTDDTNLAYKKSKRNISILLLTTSVRDLILYCYTILFRIIL